VAVRAVAKRGRAAAPAVKVVDDRQAKLVARMEKAKAKHLAREGNRFEREFWRKERMKEKARIRRKRDRVRAKKEAAAAVSAAAPA
jgi:hypothetical protein